MREMLKSLTAREYSLAIEYYREEDGRWLADIAALPGVTAYGKTKKQATATCSGAGAAFDCGPPGTRRSLTETGDWAVEYI